MGDKSIDSVAVVIPNLNGEPFLKDAVNSLLAQTYSCTVVIVDNASTDTSLASLPRGNERIIIIKNKTNLGFAGGVNTGISWALEHNYDAVALFNNDAVADSQWLYHLVNSLSQDNSVEIVTGLLLHQDGRTIDSTGEQYSIWGLGFPRSRGENAIFAPKSEYVFGATGGATLYRARLFREIGLFDEVFFAYYEDADISFRTQLAGYKVMYNADAIAYHKQGATSKKIPGFAVRQTFKNLPLLFWKNVPTRLLPVIGSRFFLAYLLMYGNTFTHGTGWAATKGLWKSLTYLPGALQERRTIQANKRVPDSYIQSILWPDLPPDQTGLRKLRRIFTRHS